MVAIKVCDYCGERWPKHCIKLSRKPNAETVAIEICGHCLDDIRLYIEVHKPKI